MAPDVSNQYRALVLDSIGADPQIEMRDTPHPDPGSAVVRVLEVSVLSYQRDIFNGQRPYPFPKPFVGGGSAIGRIVAVGPDATSLQQGQLVLVDCVVHARDNHMATFLSGVHEGSTDGSRKLMRDVWRDGTFAELVKAPLENCFPLNEKRLCHELGYSIPGLIYMARLLVPYGGLRDIGLEPGETIVVCPATGAFGSAGVQVAVAMGARVIAMGRSEPELKRLKAHTLKSMPWATIETVQITGEQHAETSALQAYGTIDAVLDLSPPAAATSTHLKSAIGALRRGGRCSAMGSVQQPIVDWNFVGNNLTVKGKLMYERDDVIMFINLLERGLFPRGKEFADVKAFSLEEWKEAFDTAVKHTGFGKMVVITPQP